LPNVPGSGAENAAGLIHPDAQPEESAETQALLARLGVALDQLPPKLRVLVVLKDVYGLSHEEIAEELGISVAAAKVRLHRGRKKLRDLLYDDERGMANAV
jgi:RNA polymerase sigma-70 factor (ECF subfamily)